MIFKLQSESPNQNINTNHNYYVFYLHLMNECNLTPGIGPLWGGIHGQTLLSLFLDPPLTMKVKIPIKYSVQIIRTCTL